ncbi:DNA topoisomerase VI subunit B [Candidatus Woesearchaeota archaeon]|nr:DNA topoisomerase VI subunit B [Candidatus Woesearchaeota archaeon]MBT6520220.1 DNA topoisomerase VI subunit B [Candidatus Woesearchaeota archaeon]MBT7367231.1 DNA topoisomerase VI subunit B [Candidatus Woesearchaeota archaeon]
MAQMKLAESTGTTKAHEMAKKQREISVAEFFAKNRHLLGFDNPKKALLTTIKEAVDNSLDACEDANMLPEICVEVIQMNEKRFKVIIEDNGPGIVKSQVPKIFAKLLYGSKFHTLKQQRGQQGIGISASVMYGQLTTGKPAKITSKIAPEKPASYFELQIDTQTNKPEIIKEAQTEWNKKTGTKIELDLEASYSKGSQSIDAYLKQTAIVNPHVTIIYTNPKAEQIIFPRAIDSMPKEAKEIKPHPYGVELGVLMKMLAVSPARTLQSFLTTEFTRVSSSVAKEICEKSKLLPNTKPRKISRDGSEKIIDAINSTKIMNPPTDCISPIGFEALEKGLKKEIKAEFYCSTTRPPSVYRGNPFVIEAAMAYGGDMPGDKSIRIMRYANRVPLQYQQSACASANAIMHTNFRNYGLQQSRNSIPVGPMTLVIHMASVWVPFTSESKEAIAHYPEIIKEVKLAIQECGRLLASYVMKKKRLHKELKKRGYIEKYIPHVAKAIKEILALTKEEEESIETDLKKMLEQTRGKIKSIEAENVEYDEEFAKIGSKNAELELHEVDESNDEKEGGDEK